MLESLFGTRAEPAARDGQAYLYRASLIGPAHRFELTDDGLAWRIGRRSGVWAYGDIAMVQLSYRPMGMQHRRFRADIRHRDGRRLRILSTSKQTVALMAPQSGYGAFIVELHRRLGAAGNTAQLCVGLRPGVYRVVAALLALFALAMAALLLRALLIGEWAGAVFIIGFAALFAWQIGGFLRRNRPRGYRWDAVPAELLG